MTNGERIKYLREKNGFTQKDIDNISILDYYINIQNGYG